ncbi:MAG: Ig-like domain-containing protein, partial [Bacteroidota bacterium]
MIQILRASLLFIVLIVSCCTAYAQLSLTSTTPSFNEQNVSASSNLVFTFSEAVSAESLTSESITVYGDFQGPIAGTIVGGGSNTISFNPDNDFLPGEKVTVTLSNQVQNLSGQSLSTPVVFQFDVMSQEAANDPPYFRQGKTIPTGFIYSLDPVDMDNDGDIDIAVSFFSNFGWYENDGSQNFTYRRIDSFSRISGTKTGDLDSDGDIDFVVSVTGSTYWYENDG